jgi:hypothetical protein
MPFKNSISAQEIEFISTNKVLGSIIDSVAKADKERQWKVQSCFTVDKNAVITI